MTKNPSEMSQSSKVSKVKQVEVDAEFAGQRLDNFLINLLKGVPKTRIYRLIRKGEVRVNKGRSKPDYRIKALDMIRIPPIRVGEEPIDKSVLKFSAKVNEKLLHHILYEDEEMLIINKPSGMAVHGGSGLSFGVIEALRILRPECKNLELVHRLDRETSGCLMIAKRRSALKRLHELLRNGQIEKQYWALVKGTWRNNEIVDKPLQKNQLSSGERMVREHPEGQRAVTSFQILKIFAKRSAKANFIGDTLQEGIERVGTQREGKLKEGTPQATLMLASPITGRTHQIRVHAKSVGNPVAGDSKYGDDSFNREMKKLGLNRLFLHAKSLTIPLEKSTEKAEKHLTIEAPLEESLSQVLFNLAGEECHV